MKTSTHNARIEVSQKHLDDLNHVNNEVYLRWVLEIAKEHWQKEAPKSVQLEFIWVVRKHELDYLKPAFIGNVLTISTWVEAMSGVKSKRIVQITRDEDLIMEAKTIWVLVDTKTGKPRRIPEAIISLFLP